MSVKQLIVLAGVLLFLLGMFTVGGPFLLALIVAILIEPALLFITRVTKLSRLWTAVILCSLFTFLAIGVILFIGVKVTAQATVFFKMAQDFLIVEVPNWKVQWVSWAEKLSPELQAGIEKSIDGMTQTAAGIAGNISRSLVNMAAKLPGMFIALIVFVIALYLFSISLPSMKRSFLNFFSERSRDKMDHVLVSLRGSIFGFLRAQLLISTITYIIVAVGLLLMNVDFPFAIALLVTLVDALPILGSSAVLLPWAAVSLVTGEPQLGIGLLLLFLVLAVVRRIIEPKILGDSVGISAISALVALYVGFQLVGVIGLFLGPAVVVIFQALRKAGLFQFKFDMD
ncbi:sporulation integral membrane protein YtvI [Paenibacillus turpanensis]|uniref:sporulation integral membrane protein YtvI n=1 Tax=Paenibacillus turpanensis TaxID=2689078 RepID=UPI001409F1BD|nr:sporulation integral membrane protein YtvI [Paenibacillus turpanensis]